MSLATRPQLYQHPAMADANGNGGDSINKALKKMLDKLAKGYPGAENFVKDETAAATASKRKGGNNTNGGAGPSAKKRRKVKEETKDVGGGVEDEVEESV